VQGERKVFGKPLGISLDGVSQQEVLRPDRPLPHLDDERLLGCRLGQVMAEPLGEAGPLPLQVRHRGDHRHRVPGRWMRLRIQNGLRARAHVGLLGERTPEKRRHRGGDLVGRPAHPRVLDVACLGECRRRRLPHVLPSPLHRRGRILGELGELELEERIVIPGEQPEEDAIRQLVRPRRPRDPKLEQPPVLRNRSDVLDPILGRWGQKQQVAAPDPVVLLLLDHRLDLFRLEHRLFIGGDRLRRDGSGVGKLAMGSETD